MAETDQQREHAKRLAQVVAAFHGELIAGGVDGDAAEWLTRDYLDRMLDREDEDG